MLTADFSEQLLLAYIEDDYEQAKQIAIRYMNDVLADFANRYSTSELTLPFVAAAFRIYSNELSKSLDGDNKSLYAALVRGVKTTSRIVTVQSRRGGKNE